MTLAPDHRRRAAENAAGDTHTATPDAPAVGISWLVTDPRLRDAARLLGLGVTLWLSVRVLAPPSSGAGIATLVGVIVGATGWLAWIATRGRMPWLAISLGAMAVGGGVAVGAGSTGLIFVGIAAAGAGFAFDLFPAALLAASAVPAFLITGTALGSLHGRLIETCAAGLAGLLSAAGRRELVQRARQSTLIATAQQRADVAVRETALVEDRNRMGRDLHDVLAHTLGAVSIQLTALDAQVGTGATPQVLHTSIQQIHGLVGDGLDEARQAVHALKGDPRPLVEQLTSLSRMHDVTLEVAGEARPLSAEVTLAAYRVAQEALTNAAKHAPGASVTMRAAFAADRLTVSVHNAESELGATNPVADTGGGHGLRGMRERVKLAGGEWHAGPSDRGWRVEARFPS